MRTLFFKLGNYEQWVRARGHLIDFNCLCRDFRFRKLVEHYRDGEKLLPCKHLIPILERIDLNFCVGYPWISGRSR